MPSGPQAYPGNLDPSSSTKTAGVLTACQPLTLG
jgi:hypothetical protein